MSPFLRHTIASILAMTATFAGLSACAPQFEPCRVTRRPCGFDAAVRLPDGTTGEAETVPPPSARATVVEFWAIHCEPCRRSLVSLEQYRGGLGNAGVQVMRVAVLHRGDPIDPVREAFGSFGLSGSFLVDWGADYARRLKIRSVPATIVLDREGRVRWLAPPYATGADIAEAALHVAAL